VFVYLFQFNRLDPCRPAVDGRHPSPAHSAFASAIREAGLLREPHTPIHSTSTQQFQPSINA